MTINQVQQEKGHESRKRRRTEADKKVVMTSAPKMSRHLLAAIRPSCQSALNTISAIPPPKHAMTQQEKELLKNLNMNVFKIKTPINVEMLRKLTIKHPNRPYVDYILDGLCNGFRYGYTMHRRQVIQNNLASIHLDIAAFRKAIAREVDLGRYAGPFDLSNPPCSTFMVNPCGLVPKKNTVPQEYRVINHQSAPRGASVNDGIDSAEFATEYENVPRATQWIRELGPGCLMMKVDIKEAYRIIPIHPVDQLLQGVAFEDKLYFDRCLAFGNRASAGIFCRLADLVTWIAMNHGIPAMIHYVDDFLLLTAAPLGAAKSILNLFKSILDAIGIPYKHEKIEGPDVRITYLGIQLDTEHMSATIPISKRRELILTLRRWMTKSYSSLNELQSLIGSLMWVAQIAPQGRTFLQELINRTRGRTKKSAKVKLNKRCKDDLAWWLRLMTAWGGLRLSEELEWREGVVENLFTDASDWGGGATFDKYFIIFPWRADIDLKHYSIQVREFFALLVAVRTFRRLWQRKRYIIQTDNAANVAAMAKGACENPLVMHMIRLLIADQIQGDFSVRLQYISTYLNTDADALSRGDVGTVGRRQ